MDLYGTAREAYEVMRDKSKWFDGEAPTKEDIRERLSMIRASLTKAEMALESEMELNKLWKEATLDSEPLGFLYSLGSICVDCFDISVAIDGDIEHAIDTRLEWEKR